MLYFSFILYLTIATPSVPFDATHPRNVVPAVRDVALPAFAVYAVINPDVVRQPALRLPA